MPKKTKTVRYEITYRSWTESPPWEARHTDKLKAADDIEALQKFNDIKKEYERCEGFKLMRIVRETWSAKRSGLPEIITVIIKTQLA